MRSADYFRPARYRHTRMPESTAIDALLESLNPPQRDANTARPYWGTYPVLLGHSG